MPQPTLLDRIPSFLNDAGRPFRRNEISEIKAELVSTFEDYCELVDLVISKTNRNRADCHVWRDLDAEDLGTLADAWIMAGQSRPRINVAVRQMIATRVYLKAGFITVNAALETWEFYKQEGGLLLWFPTPIPVPWRQSRSA